MTVQFPHPKKTLPCFGPGFRTIPLLLFTPQKQLGWYWNMEFCRSFCLCNWCGGRNMRSGNWFHVREPSFVCHIKEFVMENLKPLCMRSASRRAVFFASSRPQCARPCHARPAISTASFKLHLTPPKTSWNGTFKLIHLRKEKQQKYFTQLETGKNFHAKKT